MPTQHEQALQAACAFAELFIVAARAEIAGGDPAGTWRAMMQLFAALGKLDAAEDSPSVAVVPAKKPSGPGFDESELPF